MIFGGHPDFVMTKFDEVVSTNSIVNVSKEKHRFSTSILRYKIILNILFLFLTLKKLILGLKGPSPPSFTKQPKPFLKIM